MENKGLSARNQVTVCGWTELSRRRWRKSDGTAIVPADAALDQADQVISAGVSELCCRVALDSGSFSRAAEVLLEAANLRLSDEKLRQVVESEGRLVGYAGETEQLLLDFDARDCVAQTPQGTPTTRVYLGCDGVKVPVITDAEKNKRHERAKERRKKLRSRGCKRRRLVRRRGADQKYKEFRLVIFYDQERAHRLVSVTSGDHRRARRLMRKGALAIGLREAKERLGVVDGAAWIANRIDDSGIGIQRVCLDFYHLGENVHKARREVFGEESQEGQAWAGDILHAARHEGYEAMWERLTATRAAHRRGNARAGLDRLMNYVAERREMIGYVEFEKNGWDIGSGPTESQCKATTRRVKGRGMRWNLLNAEYMMQLEALYQSGAWDKWWTTRHLLN